MSSPMLALIWESWRTSRLEIVARIFGICAFIALLGSSVVRNTVSESEFVAVRGIVVLMLIATSVSTSTWWLSLDRQNPNGGFRLGFVRPVRTVQLLIAPMVITLLGVCACYAIPAILFILLGGQSLPMIGPLLICCIGVVLFTCLSWSPGTQAGRITGVCLAFATLAVIIWTLYRINGLGQPLLFEMGDAHFFEVPYWMYAVVPLTMAGLFLIAVRSVERQRHGDRLWVEEALASLFRGHSSAVSVSKIKSPRRHRTVLAAQIWYETRRHGYLVVLGSAVISVLVVAYVTVVHMQQPDWKNSPYIWLVTLGVAPMAMQLIGVDGALNLRRQGGEASFSPFDATQPLANDQLAMMKLLVVAVSSLIGWLLLASSAGLFALLSGTLQHWTPLLESAIGGLSNVGFAGWIGILGFLILGYVSSSAILFSFGMWLPRFKRLFAVLAGIAYGNFMLGFVDLQSDWSLAWLWKTEAYLAAVLITVGCTFALYRAINSHFLGRRLLNVVVVLWCLYLVSVFLTLRLVPSLTSIPLEAWVVGSACLLIPLASAAMAPLSIASHRHA